MAAARTFVIVEQPVGLPGPVAVAQAHQPTRR